MKARDPRWISLMSDGRYTTVGRHRDPSENDVRVLKERMANLNLTGWLAVMSGSIHGSDQVEFLLVSELNTPEGTFDEAVALLKARYLAEDGQS